MGIVLFLVLTKMAASEVCVSGGMNTHSFYLKHGIFFLPFFFFLISEKKNPSEIWDSRSTGLLRNETQWNDPKPLPTL